MNEAKIDGNSEITNKEIVELLKYQNELLKHRNTQLTVLHKDLEKIGEELHKIYGAIP